MAKRLANAAFDNPPSWASDGRARATTSIRLPVEPSSWRAFNPEMEQRWAAHAGALPDR
jgi:hypothetical protein